MLVCICYSVMFIPAAPAQSGDGVSCDERLNIMVTGVKGLQGNVRGAAVAERAPIATNRNNTSQKTTGISKVLMRGQNVETAQNASSVLLADRLAQARKADSSSSAPDFNRPIKDKWAVIIGIGNFQDTTIPKLSYPAKDARDFRNFLVQKAGFQADHVRLLLDEAATRERILTEIGEIMPRLVGPDDLIVLYFSSHGSPAERDIARKNYLIAYDSKKANLYPTSIGMQDLLSEMNARVGADRVLIVLDACHSGAADPGAKAIDFASKLDAEQIQVGKGNIILSSSQSSERSWESKTYANGIFTRTLIDSLTKAGNNKGIIGIFEDLKDCVADEVRQQFGERQTPHLKTDGWSGKDLLLCAPATKPRVISETVQRMMAPDSASAPASQKVDPNSTSASASTPTASAAASALVQVDKSAFDTVRSLYNSKNYGGAARAVIPLVKAGDRDAQYLLGVMFETGRGVPQNYRMAVQYYELAADQNSPDAQLNLALLYSTGNGVPQNHVKAAELYQKAANQKNTIAMRNLGLIYEKGQGVPQNYKKAAECYEAAVSEGSPRAKVNLAGLYERGLGVPQNLGKAVELLQSGAAENDPDSQTNLANLYASGKGVPQDETKALELYLRAAKAGERVALYNIGIFYSSGRGVPKDLGKAAEYYKLAADKGYAHAQNNLGLMYEKGQGVPKDFSKAAEFYQAAANQGDDAAQNNLGWLCEHGNGVLKDKERAKEFYRLSAAQGNKKARVNLKNLEH